MRAVHVEHKHTSSEEPEFPERRGTRPWLVTEALTRCAGRSGRRSRTVGAGRNTLDCVVDRSASMLTGLPSFPVAAGRTKPQSIGRDRRKSRARHTGGDGIAGGLRVRLSVWIRPPCRIDEGSEAVVEAKTQTLPTYGVHPPMCRLPDAAHVGAVHLQVSNMQQSVDYYQQVIGLRPNDITESSAALSAHEDERDLVTLRGGPGVSRAHRDVFGLYHFAILLPDRAALGRFAAHLESLDVRVAMADHLVSEALYLWDCARRGILMAWASRCMRTGRVRAGSSKAANWR